MSATHHKYITYLVVDFVCCKHTILPVPDHSFGCQTMHNLSRIMQNNYHIYFEVWWNLKVSLEPEIFFQGLTSFHWFFYYMVPTDHDIPFSRTFQGLLRYIFKEFSRTFLCSFKHPFAKKWSTMDFSNKTYRDHFDLKVCQKNGGGGGGRKLGMCF